MGGTRTSQRREWHQPPCARSSAPSGAVPSSPGLSSGVTQLSHAPVWPATPSVLFSIVPTLFLRLPPRVKRLVMGDGKRRQKSGNDTRMCPVLPDPGPRAQSQCQQFSLLFSASWIHFQGDCFFPSKLCLVLTHKAIHSQQVTHRIKLSNVCRTVPEHSALSPESLDILADDLAGRPGCVQCDGILGDGSFAK